MELHLGYEQAAPFPLQRHDRKEPVIAQADLLPDERLPKMGPRRLLDEKPKLKPRLKALREQGVIEIDAVTTLAGIPPAAWTYKLDNRSGLEWVLDQWKESKIKDPTVAEKFNTYRFADHKEEVIDLLLRVCTVSMETMRIVHAMPADLPLAAPAESAQAGSKRQSEGVKTKPTKGAGQAVSRGPGRAVVESAVPMPKTTSLIAKHPEVCGGEACLAGTRIPVWLLEQARRLGTPQKQLLRSYPSLTAVSLAEAWSYAEAHREEMDQAISENEND